MKRIVAVIAVAGLMAGPTVCDSVAQAANSPVSFTPAPIQWHECAVDSDRFLPAQCGYVSVPLDYSKPEGTKIKIAVSRERHTVSAARYQGVVLMNPGGPGSSGLAMPLNSIEVPHNGAATYDWIGFDPRGVGSSIPALSCNSNYFKAPRPQYVPTTQKLETTWLKRVKVYATTCDTVGGALLEHVKTIDTIQDMESIRKALGQSKINYYGMSYGARLGQLYATLYPSRVRRMILDGVAAPLPGSGAAEVAAFNQNLTTFFGWIAKYNRTYKLGATAAIVKKKYYAALSELGRKPAGGRLGAAEWNDVFVSAGYSVLGWPAIAQAFAAYVNEGRGKPALLMFQRAHPTSEGGDNDYAMFLATVCTDSAPDPAYATWYQWRVDAWMQHATAPFLAWQNTWFGAPCLYWGAVGAAAPTVDGAKAPPILLISETRDAATVFSGALEVRRLFPTSVLIEGVGGTTHAGSLNGVACTDNAIAAYLATGQLPKRQAGNRSDKKCSPVPQPTP